MPGRGRPRKYDYEEISEAIERAIETEEIPLTDQQLAEIISDLDVPCTAVLVRHLRRKKYVNVWERLKLNRQAQREWDKEIDEELANRGR